jgi:hypothetical protein
LSLPIQHDSIKAMIPSQIWKRHAA